MNYTTTTVYPSATMIYACAACFSKTPFGLLIAGLLLVWSICLGLRLWRRSTEARALQVANNFVREYSALTDEVVTLSKDLQELVATVGQTKAIVGVVQQQQVAESLALERRRRASF